ncbi:SbcC/MukB-like Walker B domain-containing protein [Actinomadura sp. NPDC048955]|uniref:ATP-binding protein n=1 Tax=Actinomadura sp. NPDC048955 TaxID=3158228 RepID=UPI0034014637
MTQDPLLHVDGATEGTTQWRAETLQVLNWGGFEGHHTIDLSAGATLLSGASGTGKSTLLDSYIALMMPSDTPFNGASNDATVGRARGEAQRNLLSYVRGKTDTGRDASTNTRRDAVLRGGDGPTWSALAMTFVDDNNRRLTVLRTYRAPRGATKTGDMIMKMATVDGALDLRDLQPLAAKDFDQADLKARFPGLTPHGTYTELAETLYARLGIGAGGDGEKALRLLARIQTGEQVKTVDQLYKTAVLERPATYMHADRASDHFADLDLAYEAMVTEGHKADVLRPIVGLHDDLQAAQGTVARIDQLGLDRAGASPFRRWQLTTQTSLLSQAIDANRVEHTAKAADAEDARLQVNDLEQRRDDLSRQIGQSGGDTLIQLEKKINELRRDLDEAHRARSRFDEHTAMIDGPAARDKAAFDQLVTDAEKFLTGSDEAEEQIEADKRKLYKQGAPLQDKIDSLVKEKTYLAGRDGLIPQHLHLARLQMAQAAGIAPTDLPFVAELIDLAPNEEAWRKAAEVTLASITRVLLVDDEKLEQLSRSIDALHLPIRVNFQGVPLKPHEPTRGHGDPRWISGKLVHKPSPFTHWIRDRVQANGIDALCVDTPHDLSGGGRRVTRNGQTRQGRRGAHGDLGDRNVIGFSNQARINEIKIELAELHGRLADLRELEGKLSDRTRDLNKRRSAYQYLSSIAWRSIDTGGIQTLIDTTQGRIDEILQDNDQLQTLQAAAAAVDTELKKTRRTQFAAENDRDALQTEHEHLTKQLGKVTAELTATGDTDTVANDVAAWLNKEFAAVGDPTDLKRFPAGIERLRGQLIRAREDARGKTNKATTGIEGIFRTYKNQWDDPNLGTTLRSYQAYRDIYDNIVQTGLHERRDEWKRRLARWSGEDLVPLNGAFDTAIDLIEERLQPVNAIIASLPFGSRRERLEIRLDRKHSDPNVAAFRRELKQLSSGLTQQMSDDEAEQRFTRLRAFMQRIGKPDDPSRSTAQRDRLLDVRKHIEITAVCLTPDGVERCIYRELGGKSGGESQELVAFIVGAALRFQLGDESRTRPRFAPVVLDEAFIKSDSEYAGRGVRAWKALGFQLIVGAPFDKVTALEPHMDRLLATTKDPATEYSYVTTLTDRQDQP